MTKGKIISIEGLDGSGKSTQHKLLVERAIKEGYQVIKFGFPQYDKPTGEIIRKFLYGELTGDPVDIDPIISALLFAYDRLESKERLINWLKDGKNIILDRYIESNLAYQSVKAQEGKRYSLINQIENIEIGLLGIPKSSLVIYLDAPVEFCTEAMNDIGRNLDLHESNEVYLRAVRHVYNELADSNPNWIRVPRHKSLKERLKKEVVHGIIWERVKPHLV